MTAFRPNDVHSVTKRAAIAARAMEADLNAADSRLGDGDTGTMLVRLLAAVETIEPSSEDLGSIFKEMSLAAAESTGSSLGTLISAGLLSMSHLTVGRSEFPIEDVTTLLAAARDEMLSLGGSQLGDKTIVDGLHAVACAVRNQTTWDEVARAARDAADETILRFRGKPCRVGRARMWPERSIGLDDPGMVALAAIANAIASTTSCVD